MVIYLQLFICAAKKQKGYFYTSGKRYNLIKYFNFKPVPQQRSTFDWLLAFIYFLGLEAIIYAGLTYLLFEQVERNPDKETVIVKNWNSFIYFVLLYAIIAIGVMLVLSSALPRQNKPLIMGYFWLSWLGLVIMLIVAFN